ncbi:Hsp20/alpha crystallin family protein [Marinobacterium sp. AK62]|uniref:Hsp20/alpha crystallin family protein n=1 Tax=Marinobacterium alkalitolerans TaxID=1542925 RepID=A0ABS3ZFF5_9GAMM|nr:Hsp20/alpha crystallin family protein [Marinobacterium alkalitolerans]MBP0050055.1 Hsp20/alpha crystallin family protein [Marinobacterium alkalitolerans]
MNRDLTRFNSLFDDTFLNDFFRPLATRSNGDKVAAIDVHETDAAYTVNVDMPGVKKEDIKLSLENGVLTVKGETRKEDKEEKDGKLIRQERHVGQFIRQLSVGSDVDAQSVSAAFNDGVLSITLPKKPAAPEEGVHISID